MEHEELELIQQQLGHTQTGDQFQYAWSVSVEQGWLTNIFTNIVTIRDGSLVWKVVKITK